MSGADLSADELTLPIKRTDGETLEDRLTANAYHNILPARYLRKDHDGELVESQEDLFERVAENIALAEAVFEAEKQDVEVTVTPDQLKPDHPRRDELASEVFGSEARSASGRSSGQSPRQEAGTDADSDVETELSVHNVNKFAYKTVVPELPDEIRDHVEAKQAEFQELMERLSFVPNSPTLMNAGDELQQLSACFVDSPADDLTDIHQTAKEAAEVFQCLTEESTVMTEDRGIISVSEVEVGDRIAQRTESGFQYKPVEDTHVYESAETLTVHLDNGLSVSGTPNHRLAVDGEWTRLDEIRAGQEVSYALGWLRETTRETPELASVASGAQWADNRGVENAEIVELYRKGLSDYEIADRLECGKSTIQRRRSNELKLPPNGDGGRKRGSTSFDEDVALELYQEGHTDAEIAEALDAHQTTVGQFRARKQLESNGTAVKSVRQPEVLTEELAELVGLWLGDGSWHQDGIRFHAGRESIADYVDHLSRQLFGTPTSRTFADGCYEVAINSHEVKRWWRANFDCKPDGAPSAYVPQVMKNAPAETVEAFLRGYFTADGTLLNGTYPKLYSASERAIDDVATLMMGLGYPVKKSVIRDEEAHPYYGLVPTTGRGREAFIREVGFVDERHEVGIESIQSVDARDSYSGDAEYTVEVESVVESGDGTVYDITVADNHEYVTDGLVSHNSGGGMGYAFWRLRPYGDAVGSTGGIASGPITFMRTFDQMCETIAQGGTRRGAQMGVMRISHPDVIEFIHAKNKDVSLAHCLRLNDPDDYTYTTFSEALEEARGLIDEDGKVPKHLRNAVEGHLSNFNISVGVTDEFMEALETGEEFTFTNPRTGEPHVASEETKEMYSRYGLGDEVTVGEPLSLDPNLIWDRIVDGAHENGEPGVVYLERINKEHSFDVEEHPDHRILATNPCVTGDTLINTGNGLVPAEELYERGTAQDIVVDGRLSEETVKEASSVYKTGEKDVFELTTEEGYELRVTADHRVMTDDGWVEAGNLDAGDTVHIQNRKGSFGQHGSAAEGRVLGWTVGDGHLKHGEERAILNFYDGDSEISESFAADVNEVVRDPVGNADYEVGVSDISRSDGYRGAQAVEQRIRSARLYEIAEEVGLVEEKLQVPDAVMRGTEEMARGFLQALFTADGSVQGTPENGRTVRLASSELDLLKQTQQLLLNFGIASRIYEERKPSGTRELPDGKGGTKEYDTKGFHDLVVSKENLVTFRDEIGLLREDKQSQLEAHIDSYTKGPCSETFVATVDSVEYDKTEQVYDLTEPETSSFIGNGVVVHNCGEQPLEEYEACNLGHINLSTLAAEGAPDWRVWSQRNEFATLEEGVERFLEDALDTGEFEERIRLGTRFLENVVTMSDFPVTEIEEKVREMRKIGLGVMGLAQLYIQLGIKYGSEEGNEVARQVMRRINHGSKHASHELAEERGTFEEWSNSKYANPTDYAEWFEKQTGESAADWADGYAIRNHNTTTIAPTGTTSMVGNTTGGCEPIYNVAYYKNVSDDVQGDEMLVEFDDYFLRTLEANDIDVDAVKQEAQEQMATNEFDGVDGLSTVPDAIGELFVVTGDLSGKDHAAVQCACQEGVDSAISKTCNFPNDATKEDMDEVYRYIYEHGGKGVTVYRDGTRSKQVLTTRADNTEFSEDMDEDEAAEVISEKVEEIFGSFEAFLDHEAVEADIEGPDDLLEAEPRVYAEKKPRPDQLHGVTQRIETGYGKLYVTINEDPETSEPFELFANTGHSGGFTNSFTDALAKTISVALRSGVDPNEIVDKLNGIRSPKVAWDKGEQINSIPDAFGVALRRYLDDEIDRVYPQQQSLSEAAGSAEKETDPNRERDRNPGQNPDAAEPETDGGAAAATGDDTASLLAAGESPECPDCGAMSLAMNEGCKTCQSCGWSEC
ncbi:ribonucleoside-diphosphate reductase [Halobacteriales archaeon QH_7_66_36]|nr:MAG: ribonucleoside-diphosphate reductase [Halobacteriales archaeon QH_7_66_36]